MPAVSRIGDIGSAHESFPDTPVVTGSDNTTVNSIPAARDMDVVESHGSPSPSPVHSRAIAGGSYNTYINSRKVAIIGTPINCGGLLCTGSHNTIVN